MTTRPNIIFVLIDDLGWADLGCQGSTFYETPRIDQLAGLGMRFTDAYAAAPVCSPTRASLLTGRYPARVGVTQYIGGHGVGQLCDVPYFHFIPSNERTVASALRDGGYCTWHVGKWHLGGGESSPTHHGFDLNIGGCEWGLPRKGFFSPWNIPGLENGPDGQYLTDHLTDEAIRLIETHDCDRPFFMNLCHYAVHTPIQAPADLVEKYRIKAARLGLNTDPFEVGKFFPCQHKRTQRIQRRTLQSDPTYAAMIENLDTNIGRLVDALKNSGKWNNTLLIFTSDNGGLSTAEGSPTCNAPLAEGKGWMEEGGNREPFLAIWPDRIPAGSSCLEPITSPDLFPTLLEAAGLPAEPGQHVDGVSLLPALEGRAFTRGPIYWHYPHYSNQGGTPSGAIRDGAWKLIETFEDKRLRLYHLPDDPGESHDLVTDQPEITTRLHHQLKAWRADINAKIPAPNVHWIAPEND